MERVPDGVADAAVHGIPGGRISPLGSPLARRDRPTAGGDVPCTCTWPRTFRTRTHVRYLEQCLAIAEQAIEQVREMSLDLSPSMLDDLGLPDTLRFYLDHQSQRTGLAVNLVVSSAWTPLPREVEAVCFRVTQEALVNVIRHASARQVQVELRQDRGSGLSDDSRQRRGIRPGVARTGRRPARGNWG